MYMNKLMFHANKVFDLIHCGECAPVNLDLEITSKCNHRCYWCAYHGEGEVSLQRIEEIVQRFIEHGGKSVTLSGGEPTMHDDFVEILILIKRWMLQVGVLTNLDTEPEKVQAMVEFCDWVRVSLDAPTSFQHNAIHGGGWDRVMENLTLFKERYGTLGLSFVLDSVMDNKYDYEGLEELIASMLEGTVDYVQFKPKVVGNVDYGISEHLYSRVKRLCKQFGSHRVHIESLNIQDIIVKHPGERCYFHHFVWQYDSQGRRCACCRREDIVFVNEDKIPFTLSTSKCPSCRADEHNQFVEYAKTVKHVNFL